MPVTIDKTLCSKCNLCIRDCMPQVIRPDAEGFPSVSADEEKFCLKCGHCLAVCPAGAVILNGVSASMCPLPGDLPTPETMLNLLRQRRSVRYYRDSNAAPEKLDQIESILSSLPTGCNDHRLMFAIVREKAEMNFFKETVNKKLRFLIKSGIMRLIYPNIQRYLSDIMQGKDVIFRDAPHMIVCATPKNAPCAEADPWIALSYVDTLLQSLKLGSCWCGFAVYAFRWIPALRKRIGIPRDYRVGAVLLFGEGQFSYARPPLPQEVKVKRF